jgi:hypothetical protein
VPWLDAVEICNSQNPLPWQDRRAARFALRHGLAGYVGADAHIRGDLSPCHQLMEPFDDAASFAASLGRAKLVHGRMSLRGWAIAAWRVANERLLGRAPAGFGANCRYPQPWRPMLGRRRAALPQAAQVATAAARKGNGAARGITSGSEWDHPKLLPHREEEGVTTPNR